MWILSCDEPEIWGGQRYYCLPGQTYTLGRVAKNEDAPASTRSVNARKGVSRKHLLITIHEVKPGDGLNIHTWSTVTIEDTSKKATWVDGVEIGTKLHNAKMTLTKQEHTFHLGENVFAFRLTWVSQTITFISASKKKISPYQSKLEKFDIKSVAAFVHGETTLVCADKRNTPKGLQALVNGVQIVTLAYVDALVAACSRPNKEEHSPAETDFDANWPKPDEYLPPIGTEPVKRDAWYFAPDSKRRNMMEGYMVYVNSSSQADSFRATTADAGGKLEYFELEENKTRPLDFIRLVEKTSKRIVIRDSSTSPWKQGFYAEVSKALNLTLAEQNEFLDAILTVDVGALCKPLVRENGQYTQSQIRAPPPTAAARETQSGILRNTSDALQKLTKSPRDDEDFLFTAVKPGSQSSSPEPIVRPTRSFSGKGSSIKVSQPYISKIVDSDDDEDFEVLPAPGQRSIQASMNSGSITSIAGQRVVGNSKLASFNKGGTQLSTVPERQSQGRKRSLVNLQEESEDEDAMMDELLPGTALMKKRRLEQKTSRRGVVQDSEEDDDEKIAQEKPAEDEDLVSEKPITKNKKKAGIANDEIIIQAVKIRAEEDKAAQEKANAEREQRAERFQGVDDDTITKFKNMGVEVTFEIKSRTDRPVRRDRAYGDEADESRWNPLWNGRKNFKKFKKRIPNPDGQMRRLAGPIVVSLVEVKKSDYGMNEGSLMSSSKRSAMAKSHVSETQRSSMHMDRSQRSGRLTAADTRPDTQVDTQEDEVATATSGRSKTASKRSQQSSLSGHTRKKQKQSQSFFIREEEDEDDSGDELKFRF